MGTEKDPTGESNNNSAGPGGSEALTDPRIAYREGSGYPYVRARPGEAKITSEDVKRMLEDFP